ncbi:hypothetical protein GH733_000898 [Mirounga leonina]|nr:hypothetical protein GH733_000898 [Mirounga leonina]
MDIGQAKAVCAQCIASGFFGDSVSLAYQRVQKVDCTSLRPVLILGPLLDVVKEMLVNEAPGKFCRCPLEVMKASQQAIERGVKDCLFVDYKRRSGHFDVTTVASIKEITEKNRHCLLDIAPHAIERLHHMHIYPIVIFIHYKSAKHIKEQRDPIYLKDKVTQRHSKEQFETAQKIEQEYSRYFTGTRLLLAQTTKTDGGLRPSSVPRGCSSGSPGRGPSGTMMVQCAQHSVDGGCSQAPDLCKIQIAPAGTYIQGCEERKGFEGCWDFLMFSVRPVCKWGGRKPGLASLNAPSLGQGRVLLLCCYGLEEAGARCCGKASCCCSDLANGGRLGLFHCAPAVLASPVATAVTGLRGTVEVWGAGAAGWGPGHIPLAHPCRAWGRGRGGKGEVTFGSSCEALDGSQWWPQHLAFEDGAD